MKKTAYKLLTIIKTAYISFHAPFKNDTDTCKDKNCLHFPSKLIFIYKTAYISFHAPSKNDTDTCKDKNCLHFSSKLIFIYKTAYIVDPFINNNHYIYRVKNNSQTLRIFSNKYYRK